MHKLVEFCRVVHEAGDTIGQMIAVPSTFDVEPPHEATEAIRSLSQRSASPEIRVLVLGPLKSGKSTLMNVLMQNARVSQISQLPAYPCYVEIRDVERDAAGAPIEKPAMVLHPLNGGPAESFPPEIGIQKLDNLLEEFITGGEDARIKYSKVEQRMDLQAARAAVDFEGLRVILIDSPGLFFKKKVDQTFFTGESRPDPQGPEYSAITANLYESCDIAIFVIRPEQLFFHNVADYLTGFRRRAKMRAFILVNASRRSRTQEGEEIKDFDQVANRVQIQKYFLNHVADNDLVAAITKGERVTLYFADLLELADRIFREQQQVSDASESETALKAIRSYIFSPDLYNTKIPESKCYCASPRA